MFNNSSSCEQIKYIDLKSLFFRQPLDLNEFVQEQFSASIKRSWWYMLQQEELRSVSTYNLFYSCTNITKALINY